MTGASRASGAGQAPPDLILHHGVLITMDSQRPSAQAIAIRGGRIVAVGANRTVLRLRGRRTKVVDLKGKTALPGFNDSHAHWIGDRSALGFSTPQKAVAAALAGGFTSISELFVNAERLAELRALDSAGQLRIRVNAYLPVNFYDQKFGIWFDQYAPRQEYSPRLRIAGVKITVDGLAIDIFLSAPHRDRPEYFGHASWTQQELTDMVATLNARGWQIAIHTGGDGAEDLVLNAFEAALGGAPNLRRHRIEHVTVVRDDQIGRIRRLGLLASFQLTHFTSDWSTNSYYGSYETTLGPGRIGWAGRWRELLDAGVRSLGSTDTPHFFDGGDKASALEAVEMAVTRVGTLGRAPTSWMLAQRLTVRQALRLLTVDAAYGTLDEKRKGTLTAGKLADLVVLSRNPLKVAHDQLGEIPVLLTMVGGVNEYCAATAGTLCKR